MIIVLYIYDQIGAVFMSRLAFFVGFGRLHFVEEGFTVSVSADTYYFKVNYGNGRIMRKICSKLIIKRPE